MSRETEINSPDARTMCKMSRFINEDWSRTGRGTHVEFADNETIPFEQGRLNLPAYFRMMTERLQDDFLDGAPWVIVHEVSIFGWKLAHKKIVFRRKIVGKDMKETYILKGLSHVHIVQLVGTYTHRNMLGIMMAPVATCDLHTFFEDVEE